MAWPLSRTPIHFPQKPIALGESHHQAVLLPQVPKQGQPARTLGPDPPTPGLRRRHRSLSSPRTARPMDHTLVSTSEQKRRGTGTPRGPQANARPSIILITRQATTLIVLIMPESPKRRLRRQTAKPERLQRLKARMPGPLETPEMPARPAMFFRNGLNRARVKLNRQARPAPTAIRLGKLMAGELAPLER